jgi:hypothetical protein
MTSKLWDQMHWGDRVSWRELAVTTVLQPGEVIPRMGDMRMMVERGYRNQLTVGAYHEMMQTTKLNQLRHDHLACDGDHPQGLV